MKRKGFWVIPIASLLALTVVLFIFFKAQKKGKEGSSAAITGPEGSDSSFSVTTQVKLFFFTDTSTKMVPVDEQLEIPNIREAIYKKFVDLLLRGKENYIVPVPKDTSLLAAYFLKDAGVLVLDFSENVHNLFPGGSAAEEEFVYFIVDNVCFNFREVKKVAFLFGGNEQKELSGHLDMERAYYPDFSRLGRE